MDGRQVNTCLLFRLRRGERFQEVIFGLLSAPAGVRERMKTALTPMDSWTTPGPLTMQPITATFSVSTPG
jgi:hypothetical protein